MTAPTSSSAALLFGTDAPAAPWRRLQAGELTAELVDGNLRYIRFRGHEVLRAVAYVVRDRDWGTYAPLIHNLTVEERAGAFSVAYRAVCSGPVSTLVYDALISASGPEGRLRFEVAATPDGDFETNRCGFCVLHPIEGVAGSPAKVEHCDGRVVSTSFPDLIEPWQPLKDIRAITHEVEGGIAATCRFEGDVFEMEDQRNWSDASYKTYVRPLALPWPYVLPARETNRQTISLGLSARARGAPSPAGHPAGGIAVEVGGPEAGTLLPEIALLVTPEESAAALVHADLLAAVAPQALICHFDPAAGHGAEAMRGFAGLQRASPAKLILECVVAAEIDVGQELLATAQLAREAGVSFAAVAVSPAVDRRSTPPGSSWPPCPPLRDVYAAARMAFPGVPLGGGTFSYFTELNRKRPPVERLDFVTHCTNPIVHAADDASVMETLEALPHIFRSARAIIGADKPYHVGPSTIAMRQNPYGSRTMPNPLGERIAMADRDPRHAALFGAAWAAGYAARATQAGVRLLCLSSFSGPFGLFRAEAATEPDSVHTYPLFAVVRGLARLAEGVRLPCRSSRPRDVLALGSCDDSGEADVWIVNLTPGALDIEVQGSFASAADWSTVHPVAGDVSPLRAGSGKLTLGAYSVAGIRASLAEPERGNSRV